MRAFQIGFNFGSFAKFTSRLELPCRFWLRTSEQFSHRGHYSMNTIRWIVFSVSIHCGKIRLLNKRYQLARPARSLPGWFIWYRFSWFIGMALRNSSYGWFIIWPIEFGWFIWMIHVRKETTSCSRRFLRINLNLVNAASWIVYTIKLHGTVRTPNLGARENS